jgi:hypothetical protein
VHIKEGRAVLSDMIFANGDMHEFSTHGIMDLIRTGETDVVAMVKSAQVDSLSPAEVVGHIKQAMLEHAYEKAESYLEWLKQSNDERAYATGYEMYRQGLRGELTKKAEAEHQHIGCSAPIKTASSLLPVCSHLGLPVNQVCQDEKGRCQPLYRKRMEQSNEGAYFMNSKIFI